MKVWERSRRGILMLEAVIALALLSMMAGALFPMISHVSRVLTDCTVKLHLQEEAVFSVNFMTDRIRRSLERSSPSLVGPGDMYYYYDYDQNGNSKEFGFAKERNAWYLLLYDHKGKQPITGDAGSASAYRVEEGMQSYFIGHKGGLVELSYQMKHEPGKDHFPVETAVLPLRDYFQQGEWYE